MFLLPDGHTYKNDGLSISELPQDLRLLITYVKSVKKNIHQINLMTENKIFLAHWKLWLN